MLINSLTVLSQDILQTLIPTELLMLINIAGLGHNWGV